MNLMTARRSHFDEVYPTKAQLARIARLTMMAELAASIAHEIGDPLCAVVTSAEALSALAEPGRARSRRSATRSRASRAKAFGQGR
jgi:C4-dicarboxylate-specific signal transduction histidine kinase